MQLQYLGRIGHPANTHFGSMYKAVFMKPDIDKSPEGGNVSYYSGEFHSGVKILNLMNILCKREFFRFLSRIKTGFGKFLKNIAYSRETETIVHIIGRLYL